MLNDITGHKALIERLLIAITSGKSLIIQGPNGVGKTSAVYEVAKIGKRPIEAHLGPSISPETFGMNVPSKDFDEYRYVWNSRLMSAPENTIHLVDEFGHSPPTVQALLGEPVLSGTIQGKSMPKGNVFILTANRLGDTAGTHAISRLINTRCPTITYYGPTDDEYIGTDKTPGYMRVYGHPAITTALEYNSEMIHFLKGSYADTEKKADKLPTHRGWVECSAELNAAEELFEAGKISAINRMSIIASHVGDKAAAKCEAIVRLWQDLPDFSSMTREDIATMDVPSNAVVRSLIVNQVVSVAKEAAIAKIDGLISRFPAEEQKVLWVQLTNKSTHFTSTNAYQKFAGSIGKYLNQ